MRQQSHGLSEPQSLDSTRPLDGLRGIAALMVLVSHIGGAGYYPWIRLFGQLGVVLFFVLSGFLMGILYMEHSSSVRHWLQYAVRRIFRVYPMFVFMVVGSFLIYEPMGQEWAVPVDQATLLDHLLLRAGVMHLWTIPVELKFYACFPVIALLVTRVGPHRNRLVLLTSLLVGFMFLAPSGNVLSVWHYINVFLFGLLAAQIYLNRRSAEILTADRTLWNFAVVASLLALVLLIPSVSERIMGTSFRPFQDTWVTATPCLVLVLAATQCDGWVRALLVSRQARFLGTISYSLYLTHVHVVRGIRELELPSIIAVALMVAVAFPVAWACYRLIETPFREMGRKLAARVGHADA